MVIPQNEAEEPSGIGRGQVGAKTAQPLQFLKPLLDDIWDYVAI